MFLFFIFVLGLLVGSFLNVLADRLPREEAVIKGRSHCEKCKKTLKWYDLIPFLSFLQLRGKCRYCHSPLSFYYPIVELTTGILFVIIFTFVINNLPFTIYNLPFIESFYYLFIASSLIVVFFADLKYGIIPDKIVFPAITIAFFYLIINHSSLTRLQLPEATADGGQVINHLLAALGAALFFWLLSLIKIKGRTAMGFGDVKFAFLMGLILGFPNVVVGLYIAFLTGAIVGCILIIWRKKKTFGTSIPFGPFLVIGTLIAIFFGEILTQSFLRLASLW